MTPRMKTELRNEVVGFLRRFQSLFVADVVAPIESEMIWKYNLRFVVN